MDLEAEENVKVWIVAFYNGRALSLVVVEVDGEESVDSCQLFPYYLLQGNFIVFCRGYVEVEDIFSDSNFSVRSF